MIYNDVFKKLSRRGVKYLVVGGVAVVLHGYTRFTADLDLIIDPSPENIDKLFSALRDLGYLPRVPVTAQEFKEERKRREWMDEKNTKVFSFFHRRDPLKIIDILIGELPRYKKFKKVIFEIDGVKIPAASVSELKQLKEKAGRVKDREDIRFLSRIERVKRCKR